MSQYDLDSFNMYKMTTEEAIITNKDRWVGFLKSSAFLYKYDFDDQISLYAFSDKAKKDENGIILANLTACASAEQWRRLGARINENAKGMPILKNGSLLDIYDISDTDSSVNIWKPYDSPKFYDILSEKMGTAKQDLKSMIDDRISRFMAGSNFLKEFRQGQNFQENSIKLIVYTRCGIDTKDVDLSNMHYNSFFNDIGLNYAAENIFSPAKDILKEIEKSVKEYENSEKDRARSEEQAVEEDVLPQAPEQKTQVPESQKPNSNIIGNSPYRNIRNKTYRRMVNDVGLKLSAELEAAGIKYSGKINNDKTITFTFGGADIENVNRIISRLNGEKQSQRKTEKAAKQQMKQKHRTFTHEELRTARNTNLVDFLSRQGEELKKVGQSEYTMKAHDSMRINGNKFYWNSRDFGGNAIDFCIKYYGMSFQDSVNRLLAYNGYNLYEDLQVQPVPKPREQPKKENKEEKKPEEPEKPLPNPLDTKTNRIYAYLTKTRGISPNVVGELIFDGLIAQDIRGNAVFKIFDSEGNLSGAEINGTLSDSRFKELTEKKGNTFVINPTGKKPERAIFFESAIDAISYYDLHRNETALLVSMAGLKHQAVLNVMNRYGIKAENCLISSDNDEKGIEFQKKMKDEYNINAYPITADGRFNLYENIKDWNDLLRAEAEKNKMLRSNFMKDYFDSNEIFAPSLSSDEITSVAEEFFNYDNSWHSVSNSIADVAAKYRNGENIYSDITKALGREGFTQNIFLTDEAAANNGFDSGYIEFSAWTGDDGITFKYEDNEKFFTWEDFGKGQFNYIKTAFRDDIENEYNYETQPVFNEYGEEPYDLWVDASERKKSEERLETLLKRIDGKEFNLNPVGKFYELYGREAQTAADVLGLKLTEKVIDGVKTPMVGFPNFALKENIKKLTDLGYIYNIKKDPAVISALEKYNPLYLKDNTNEQYISNARHSVFKNNRIVSDNGNFKLIADKISPSDANDVVIVDLMNLSTAAIYISTENLEIDYSRSERENSAQIEHEKNNSLPAENVPDNSITTDDRNKYGYTSDELLPLNIEKALELFDKGASIYLLHYDNTEALAENRAEVEKFDGIFGIEPDEWERFLQNEKNKAEENSEPPVSSEKEVSETKENTEQPQKTEQKNSVIGNTAYRYISKKTYRKFDNDTAEKIAATFEEAGLKYSGVVRENETTLTFSGNDIKKAQALIEQITGRENAENKKTELSFSEQVDNVLNGTANRYNDLKVCDTPQILLDAGLDQLPILYTQRHLRDALMPKGTKGEAIHHHGLTTEIIKKMPQALENPVMIYDSLSKNDSIVVLTDLIDGNNNPIIAAIRPNGTGKYNLDVVPSNFMMSIHGRENIDNQIENAIKTDKLLYCNKEKSQDLFRVLGLQLSKGVNNNLDYNVIIHQSRNIVKENKQKNQEKTAENSEKSKQSNIIGNIEYKYISKKTYRKFDSVTAEKIASAFEKAGIKFSGRVGEKTTTFTFSGNDIEQAQALIDGITNAEPDMEKDTQNEQNKTAEPKRDAIELTLDDIFGQEVQLDSEEKTNKASVFTQSFSQDIIDLFLIQGSNTDNARMITAAEFMKQKPIEEIAESLKNIYNGGFGIQSGGRIVSAWYGEDGIHLSSGKAARYNKNAQVIPWNEAAKRIEQLLDEGKFASNVELAEADGFERQQLAQRLIYLYRDLSDEGKQQNLFSTLKTAFQGMPVDFPRRTELLKGKLNDPEFIKALSADFDEFKTAYKQNRSIMRFHFYNADSIHKDLKELELPKKNYETSMTSVQEAKAFITDDEINADLSDGSDTEGSKNRIHNYFTKKHTLEEKAAFLRKEYGIGGHSSINSSQWHDSKGIKYTKHNCEAVQLSWEKAAKRIDELIGNNRYLNKEKTPEKDRESADRQTSQNKVQAGSANKEKAAESGKAEAVQNKEEVKTYIPLYKNTADYARENGELDSYRASNRENRRCRAAVEKAISDNFDGINLKNDAVDDVLKQFGAERLSYVLASTIKEKRGDSRFSRTNREWAETVDTSFRNPDSVSEIVNSHSTVLNSFTDIFKKTASERTQAIDNKKDNSAQIEQKKAAEPDTVKTEIVSKPENFRITDYDLTSTTPKAKFRDNINAIKTLFSVESENRQAAPEEQKILSKYVGWGGLDAAFDSSSSWANEYRELKELLPEKQYKSARASVNDSFYTPPVVIEAVYKVLENMGFKGGRILEPSMGVGNFFGMLPENMKDSKLYGVEIDDISGRIAKLLYPKANIQIKGFEETTFTSNTFDAAVGNVPFGTQRISDKDFKGSSLIHDYFFKKALDRVRPGGVVAFITSKGTLDKNDSSVRKYLAERADLLGAVRLPDDTFKKNAGTEVTSDIIFLQKRETLRDTEKEGYPDWVDLAQNPEGIEINSYFVNNPDMILGEMKEVSGRFGTRTVCEPFENADLAELLDKAVSNINGSILPYEIEAPEVLAEEKSVEVSPEGHRNFCYDVVDGDVYYRENNIMTKTDFSKLHTKNAAERMTGMIEISRCLQELIRLQLENGYNDDISKQRNRLNTLYDNFTEKYGLLSSRTNSSLFRADDTYPLLQSLENINDKGELESKADIFTKRTILPYIKITSVDTAAEALAVSVSEKAGVDLDLMAELCSKTKEEIINELEGVIFENPITKKYETADEYLSGNVREKLSEAKTLVEMGADKYKINVKALEQAQPKDLKPSEISVQLGSTWVPTKYYEQFMYELLQTPKNNQSDLITRSSYKRDPFLCSGYGSDSAIIAVDYNEYSAAYAISNKRSSFADKDNILANKTYGTNRKNAYEIIEESLNLKPIKIFDYIEDEAGKKHPVLNEKETLLAQEKQNLIKSKFKEWIFDDAERTADLCKIYNEKFNSIRPREYNGNHINFVGMNPEIELRDHQKNAIAHTLYGGNTLLAHSVGAGKTYEIAASAMESKRLGLCSKSLIVVPKAIVNQVAKEFLQLYPAANILVPSENDFSAKNRQKFCSRIATGNYDAVIISHNQFERIPLSQERQKVFIEDEIEEITNSLKELKKQKGERGFTVKSLESTKKNLENKLKALNNDEKRDKTITFEELGVDKLYVDEAHIFKNCFFSSKMGRNVAGINASSNSQRASDMQMKCRYLDEKTGSKGIVFSTGTPVSNSMSELFTMQNYLQHETLKKNGLNHFDAWASTFGETQLALELAPEGKGYRMKTRFSKFFNLPELMTMFKETADIKTADVLNLPVPEARFHTVAAEPSEHQRKMVDGLAERAKKIRNRGVRPEEDNMLKVTNDGRLLALDQRIINPLLPDEPGSKVNACVENVFKIWQDTAEKKSTQLIFSDISTPNGKGDFCVYDDVKNKLIQKGVPKEQIAFIHDFKTDGQKQALFSKMNKGEIRVLLGSTSMLGTGVNCQERLIAAHHLDCPWKPADLEQRNGRIIRQGNTNDKVDIFNYVTKGTFDSYLFQLVENKQRFISQVMTSKSPARSAEDIDDSVLNYAQIKALAAGDTRIKEKMDLDIDVNKLRTLFASWQAEKRDMQSFLLTSYPEKLKEYMSAIKGFEADIALAEKTAGKEFSGMTVNGRFYDDKKEAGQALLNFCTAIPGEEEKTVGEYRGFKAYAKFDSFSKEFKMTLRNKSTISFLLGSDIFGNITRMDNALAALPAKKEEYENKLDALEKNAANTKTQIDKPFSRLEELHEKEQRLEKLNMELTLSADNEESPEKESTETKNKEKSGKKKDEACL